MAVGRVNYCQLFLLSILLILVCFGVGCNDDLIHRAGCPKERSESITFIMGEDTEDREFYTLGEAFFRVDSVHKTDRIVKHIRSLEELLVFLNLNVPDKPWGRIEVVVHGNVWSGLSAKILEGGERAYPKDLLKMVVQGKLPTLEVGIVDSSTQINIWGCGIGNNLIMNVALDSMFKDRVGNRPKVVASDDFVIFKKDETDGRTKRVLASYWPYFYKRGYRPSESVIVEQMRKQYPEQNRSWKSAFESKNGGEIDDLKTEQFSIPISWVVTYPTKEERPNVESDIEKMAWVKSQPDLMKRINDLSIPIDKYTWNINKVIHRTDTGKTVPAIKAIGMSTIMCFLENKNSEGI